MGLRILIIDDNEDVIEVFRSLLTHGGHEPYTARSGGEAFEHLDAGLHPDLVLLDYMMPGQASRSILRGVRARFADVPIVVVSGVDESPIPEADAFIRKPFPYDRINEIVAKFARVERGRAPSAQ